MYLKSGLMLLLISPAGLAFAEGRCPDGYFPIGGGNAGWEGCEIGRAHV